MVTNKPTLKFKLGNFVSVLRFKVIIQLRLTVPKFLNDFSVMNWLCLTAVLRNREDRVNGRL